MPTSATTPDRRSDRYPRYTQVVSTPTTRLSRRVHPNGISKGVVTRSERPDPTTPRSHSLEASLPAYLAASVPGVFSVNELSSGRTRRLPVPEGHDQGARAATRAHGGDTRRAAPLRPRWRAADAAGIELPALPPCDRDEEHRELLELPHPRPLGRVVAPRAGPSIPRACLRTTGRPVFPINPMSVSRYRERHSVARRKSDASTTRSSR
jgi:hypothetical protein